jgi:hypothetical protein
MSTEWAGGRSLDGSSRQSPARGNGEQPKGNNGCGYDVIITLVILAVIVGVCIVAYLWIHGLTTDLRQ